MINRNHFFADPYRNLLILATLIIVSEMTCYFMVSSLFPLHSESKLLLIYRGLLLLILIPGLYFFVYKPKAKMIEQLMAAQKANEKLGVIVANSSIMLFSLRVKGEPIINTEWASDNIEQVLGYSKEEVHAPDWWFKNIHPHDKSGVIAKSAKIIEGHEEHLNYEYRFKHKNGEYIWINDEQKLEFDEQGNLLNILCIWKDISEKKLVEMELTIAAHTFESREGILITDADKRILKVNATFEKITGLNFEEVVGQTPAILKSGKHDADFYSTMWKKVADHDYWQGEVWNKRKSGEVYPEQLTITAIKDSQQKVTNYIGTFNDITDRKAQEEQTKYAAYYDDLTALPNRRLLNERLERVIVSNGRSEEYAALLFLDVDRFKILNDTYGHALGDQFLIEISKRLKLCIRESDTLSRFGGDEFVILLSGLSVAEPEAMEQVKNIAEKVRLLLAEPYKLVTTIKGQQKSITHIASASLGLVLFSGNDTCTAELIKKADLAMYEAKSSGGDSICVHKATTTKSSMSKKRIKAS